MSARQDHKKDRERLHLERFIQSAPALQDATIVPNERPDFVAISPEKRVGIEHRQLFLDEGVHSGGSALRAAESNRENIVRRAQRRYEGRATAPKVAVAVFWLDHVELTRTRRGELPAEIAECVQKNLPSENSAVSIEQTGLPGSPLPPEIDALRITRFDVLKRNHWSNPTLAWIGALDFSYLSTVIAEKEGKLPDYGGNLDAIWLLLVVEGFNPSSALELPKETAEANFETMFDKVFVLFLLDGDVHELRTSRRSS